MIEEAVVARAEPEEAVLEETTMETYDWLSSVDLDKVKNTHHSIAGRRPKKLANPNNWPSQET